MQLTIPNAQIWLFSLPLIANIVSAASCRPFNHVYPPPRNATSHTITSASERLNLTFAQLLENETLQVVTNSTSASVDVFSIHDTESLFTFHHTASSLATSGEGVKEVGSNTIYRVASISKAWTLYVWLLATGDSAFNDPVTKYVSELAEYARNNAKEDQLNVVDWNSITIGALASQLSGGSRDTAWGPQIDARYQQLLGLPPPPIDVSDSSFCGGPLPYSSVKFACNRSAFFDTNLGRPPTTAPFSSPVYANTPYQILAYALENITNTSFAELFQTHLVEPLDLKSTFYSAPADSNDSIIPVNASISGYNADFLDSAPFGGYYSSAHDVSIIARSILNSTFLSPAQTRRWLKPLSFLPPGPLLENGGVVQAVGAPWEIIRAPTTTSTLLDASSCGACDTSSTDTNATAAEKYQTWIYTKEGDLGMYSSLTALMPEFDVGFTVLAAGSSPRALVLNVADMITETFVSALFEAARAETATTYVGTFVDDSTNSSVVLEIPNANVEDQGLRLIGWRYNGTDFLQSLSATIFGLPQGMVPKVTLYPDRLTSTTGADEEVEEGWRAAFTPAEEAPAAGAFSSSCWGWSSIGGQSYGGIAFDDFRFRVQVDKNGARRAVGLQLPVLQVNLTRAE
ncbi:hypothetical protein PMZ80_007176 [Knufia obscura]|uniref:Beta-lactamase-related domain-containing protein n=1 Tax=Knufia obscura TaxID=1635080 RepID=A0ABR0RKK0_9EURO|nr:hypothetical protein PMZ80_007176 [Knufia obscura]